MKLAALFSGGKDSMLALAKASRKHEIKSLVSIFPKNPASYMFHTENIRWVGWQAQALDVPLVSRESCGEKEEELEDLRAALESLKGIEGLVCGAVESEYQRSRVSKIAQKLDLEVLTPLWKQNPETLLREMIKDGYEIIITAVKADGFSEEWLGRRIDENCLNDLLRLVKSHKIHLLGEGGEYETFVLNAPLFKKRLELVSSKNSWERIRGELQITRLALREKQAF